MDTAKEWGEIQHRSMRKHIDIEHWTASFSVTGQVTDKETKFIVLNLYNFRKLMVINFTQRYIDKMTHFAQWVQESQNTWCFRHLSFWNVTKTLKFVFKIALLKSKMDVFIEIIHSYCPTGENVVTSMLCLLHWLMHNRFLLKLKS